MSNNEWAKVLPVHEVLRELWFEYDEHLDRGPIVAHFRFDSLSVYVNVCPDDDTIELANEPKAPFTVFRKINVSDSEYWKPLIGRVLSWTHVMINNQGYQNGVSFGFANEQTSEVSSVMLVAGCSTLSVYQVQNRSARLNFGERALYENQ